MTNDVQFEFMGLDPDYKLRAFVALAAEKLHFSAPSDSAMKLAIRKGKDAFQASCRIASQAGIFVAETISDNPVRAIQQLEHKVRTQVEEWKNRRFGHEGSEAAKANGGKEEI
jgi:ribosome-associated translation inhibitor RaiA